MHKNILGRKQSAEGVPDTGKRDLTQEKFLLAQSLTTAVPNMRHDQDTEMLHLPFISHEQS